MRRILGAVVALLLVGAASARAEFVGDVSVTGGLGTVRIDDTLWLTRDGGQSFRRVVVDGHRLGACRRIEGDGERDPGVAGPPRAARDIEGHPGSAGATRALGGMGGHVVAHHRPN